jgi:transcriptional regulator GlxA family with amidase domain
MQRIGFITLPGFQMMSVGVLCVFEFANKEVGEPVYDVHLLSETGGSIRSSIGISVATEPFDDTTFDTLIVDGSASIGSLTPGVIKFMHQAPGRSRRVAATCVTILGTVGRTFRRPHIPPTISTSGQRCSSKKETSLRRRFLNRASAPLS